MKFRIAAGEIDRIRGLGGRLVGQRREEARSAPCRCHAVEQRRIGEGEGGVAGDGDPLAQRWARRCAVPAAVIRSGPARSARRWRSTAASTTLGGAIDEILQPLMLGRPAPGPDAGPAAPAPRRAAPRPAPAGPRAPRAWRSMASWAGPPTRLRITPAIGTSGRWPAKPRSKAATDAAWPRTSTTSTTGKPAAPPDRRSSRCRRRRRRTGP